MKFDILKYSKLLSDNNITIIYSGPIWTDNLSEIAEILQRRLDLEAVPESSSQSIFSIFVEQMNNMMMYSAEKECIKRQDNSSIELSKGIFILGMQGKTYFIQSCNVIKNSAIQLLKSRIDYLNTLDKKELRQYYKEQIKADNNNPESKGAGIGLIEIARRATSKIDYEFIPQNDEFSYFTLYVTV